MIQNIKNMSLARSLYCLKSEEIQKFLGSFDSVLTDCDGVLWKEAFAIDGAADVLSYLKSLGKKVFYVTNNSTKTRDEYVVKCQKLGFPALKEEIAGTAHLVASYLKNIHFTGKAYVVGSPGLSNELTDAGIDHFGIGPDNIASENMAEIFNTKIDQDVKAVVVGFDLHISYAKLLRAATYLKNPDVLFIATNGDEQFPMDSENVIPGTGTMVKAVETCSLRKAQVLGKPNTLMFEALALEHNINPARAIMIGDRANSDILFGKNVGMQTLLVYSGVTSKEDITRWQESSDEDEKLLIPDFTLETLGDMLAILKSVE